MEGDFTVLAHCGGAPRLTPDPAAYLMVLVIPLEVHKLQPEVARWQPEEG